MLVWEQKEGFGGDFYRLCPGCEAFVFSCLKKNKKKNASPTTLALKHIFSNSPPLSLSLAHTHTHIFVHTHTHTCTHRAVRTNTHAHRQSAVPFPQLVAWKQNTLPVPALHTHTNTHMCMHQLRNCPLHTLKGIWHRLLHCYQEPTAHWDAI